MKKTQYLIIAILLFSTQLIAQNDDNKFEFNVQFGLTTSLPKTSDFYSGDIAGEPILKSKPSISGYLQFETSYILSEKSEIEIGLGYYLDRYSIDYSIGPIVGEGTRSISNIRIPISYNYNLGKDNMYQFGVGFYTNYILSAREKGLENSNFDNGTIINDDDSIDIQDKEYDLDKINSFNKFNFGVLAEIQKNIKFSENLNGFIRLRVNQDINAIKNNSGSSLSGAKMNNEKEATTFNIGLGFDL